MNTAADPNPPEPGREITIQLSADELAKLCALSADWGVAPADIAAGLLVMGLQEFASELAA